MRSNIRSLHNNQNFLTGKRGWKAGLLTLGFLFLWPLFGLHAQDVWPTTAGFQGPVPHYLFLIDTSYSMGLRLPMRSETQWQLAVAKLSAYLQNREGRYALAEFSDTDTFRLILPFTAAKSRILTALTRPQFWEATDVRDALISAQRYVESAGLKESTPVNIVVVSDAIDTRGTLYSLPTSCTADRTSDQTGNISIELLTVDQPFNPAVEMRVRNWGGQDSWQDSRQPHAEAAGSIEYRAESSLRFSPRSSPPGRGLWLVMVAILALCILVVPACAYFFCRNGGNASKRSQNTEPGLRETDPAGEDQLQYSVHFMEHHRQNGNRKRRIEFLGSEQGIPLNIGPNGFVRAGRENCQVKISFEEDGYFITSDTPLLINGVAVRRRKLRPGLTIAFGARRFELLRIERKTAQREVAPPDTRRAGVGSAATRRAGAVACFKRILPVWAAGALLVISLYAAMLIFDLGGIRTGWDKAFASNGVYKATAYLRFTPYDWQREFVLPQGTAADGSIARSAARSSAARSAGRAVRSAVDTAAMSAAGGTDALKIVAGSWDGREWQFDGLAAERPVDYLFFHAHPDDEALDFGGLLAKLEQEGLRTAVVLFTDGESGLSRGPERVADSAPGVLKSVRIQEASTSLRILGADLYVRLGLRNHPYSSQRQVLPIEQVYTAWGGYESVAGAIELLIEQLQPQVIVSPDGPTDAREHFEHEAVGLAVLQVLERMQAEQSADLPQRHLRLVDPMQQGVYSRFTRVDVLRPVWPHVESPRSVQNRALKAHQSQIDARIVGLEYTPLFESEYYQVRDYNE